MCIKLDQNWNKVPRAYHNILKAEINPVCSEASFKIMLTKMSVQSNNKDVNYVIEYICIYIYMCIYILKVLHLFRVLTQLRSLYWGSVWLAEITFCHIHQVSPVVSMLEKLTVLWRDCSVPIFTLCFEYSSVPLTCTLHSLHWFLNYHILVVLQIWGP